MTPNAITDGLPDGHYLGRPGERLDVGGLCEVVIGQPLLLPAGRAMAVTQVYCGILDSVFNEAALLLPYRLLDGPQPYHYLWIGSSRRTIRW